MTDWGEVAKALGPRLEAVADALNAHPNLDTAGAPIDAMAVLCHGVVSMRDLDKDRALVHRLVDAFWETIFTE